MAAGSHDLPTQGRKGAKKIPFLDALHLCLRSASIAAALAKYHDQGVERICKNLMVCEDLHSIISRPDLGASARHNLH